MSNVKAVYSTPDCNRIFEIQQDSTAIENITGSILQLKDQLNEFLTQIMEKEASTLATTTTTKEDIEEEQDEGEYRDSPMSTDRPDAPEKQNVKKPKINEK